MYPLNTSIILTYITIASLIGTILAQSSSAWCDAQTGKCFQAISGSGITVAAAFSNSTTATDFVGEIIAPTSAKWVGYALGGSMTNNILLLVWPNSNTFVSSARMVSRYSQPTSYSGPILKQLSGSQTNSTHWKYVFHCSECLSWTDSTGLPHSVGNSTQVQAFVWGKTAVKAPSNPNSNFTIHDGTQIFSMNVDAARTANYSSYLL